MAKGVKHTAAPTTANRQGEGHTKSADKEHAENGRVETRTAVEGVLVNATLASGLRLTASWHVQVQSSWARPRDRGGAARGRFLLSVGRWLPVECSDERQNLFAIEQVRHAFHHRISGNEVERSNSVDTHDCCVRVRIRQHLTSFASRQEARFTTRAGVQVRCLRLCAFHGLYPPTSTAEGWDHPSLHPTPPLSSLPFRRAPTAHSNPSQRRT